MHSLSVASGLRLLESSRPSSAVEKALTLLGLAYPEMSRDELLALPTGQRDRLLLKLRESTLGRVLPARIECPQCSDSLETEVDIRSLLEANESEMPGDDALVLREGVLTIRFRLPNSSDLLAAAGCPDAEAARGLLLSRCVLDVSDDGREPSAGSTLPESVVDALSETLDRLDPLSEIELQLRCPGCGHEWAALLEPAEFLWEELSDRSARLLMEIDALARAYGWREEDILAMSAERRRLYVEMVIQ